MGTHLSARKGLFRENAVPEVAFNDAGLKVSFNGFGVFVCQAEMFITYTHVDQIRSQAKKWQVQSYQNLRRHEVKSKSTRTKKPRVLPWSQALNILGNTGAPTTSGSSPEDGGVVFFVEEKNLSETVIGSLRRDPFDSWPMENTRRVQLTVDYCES